MKLLDPKNDVAFFKIFANENKKEPLLSFLNSILCFTGTDREIIDFTVESPYRLPRLEGLRDSILDIKAVDKRNIHYIISVQLLRTFAYEKKLLYYIKKASRQQPAKAENYPKKNQELLLSFLDFEFFEDSPGYASRYFLMNEKTSLNNFLDFELNLVELPKFTVPLEQLEDIKEKWIYFFKNAGNMTMIPKEIESPVVLKEAFEAADQKSWTKEELESYDNRGILIQDERGRVQHAYEEGVKKGVAIEVAKNAFKDGVPIQMISKITGLLEEEIREI